MKRKFVFATTMVSAVVLAQACSNDPVAPKDELDILHVDVTTRSAQPSESVPSIDVSSKSGVVSIRVVTRGMCAARVTAFARREAMALSVVANVYPDPGALCAPIISTAVVEYKTNVAVTPGPQVVNVFEARGGDSPQLLGSKTLFVRAF